ncbi:type II secretion system F family protein [Candidatus Sodalis endolongispinus]|uniref:Type II secretion system F family protein n=1 Tax=Candidatus Sodalis endolongispinus TaxID=2812662 RepID=A0ABS5YBH0_9GAMM|nr:type II secretion system F family protein [Candidatus Sodalis endolongispinus]MBT9432383.1 type II secretion system F family protein [Candidatus Sodalis endolongispinus]
MSGCWLWRWQGLSAEGQLCRGEVIGRSRRDCGLRLVALGHQPFRLRIHGWLPARYWQRRVLIDLTDRLASLLQTGLTLLGAEYPRAGWRCLLAQIGADIERGVTLSRACAAWPQVFPPVWCAMFALGELTGRLDSCCAELVQSEARLWRLRQQVMRSLRYPLLVSMGAVGVLLLMLLPAFARIYASAGVPLPSTAALLLRFAAHAGEQGLVYLAVALALYAVWRRLCHYHPRWRHRLRATALWLPLAGPLLRHHALHQLLQTLSMTHRAGIALDRALAVAARAEGHPRYRQAVLRCRQDLRRGKALHQTLAPTSLFPAHCRWLIRNGELTGTLDEVLSQLARLHGEQAREKAEQLAQLAEPALLLLTGAMVCGLVVILYLPLLQLGEVFSQF